MSSPRCMQSYGVVLPRYYRAQLWPRRSRCIPRSLPRWVDGMLYAVHVCEFMFASLLSHSPIAQFTPTPFG